jgi:electron transfer flavoprotein beta subunit
MGQTGVLIGEILEMSTSTLVIETDLKDSSVRVKRELESGWFQWVELPLPASISIQSGLNTPRYPSLKGIMGAKKKEIKVFLNSDINSGSKSQNIEKISLPETTKKTEFIEGDSGEVVTRLVNILKNEIKVV